MPDIVDLRYAAESVARLLAPAVVRIRFSLEDDWAGEPAVFFRVVLSDEASQRSTLYATTVRVEAGLQRMFDFAAMGRYPYYNYRSQSEQAALRSEDWE